MMFLPRLSFIFLAIWTLRGVKAQRPQGWGPPQGYPPQGYPPQETPPAVTLAQVTSAQVTPAVDSIQDVQTPDSTSIIADDNTVAAYTAAGPPANTDLNTFGQDTPTPLTPTPSTSSPVVVPQDGYKAVADYRGYGGGHGPPGWYTGGRNTWYGGPPGPPNTDQPSPNYPTMYSIRTSTTYVVGGPGPGSPVPESPIPGSPVPGTPVPSSPVPGTPGPGPPGSTGVQSTGSAIPPSSTGPASPAGSICINWTGDFHWLFQGGFGSESGYGGAAASRCWPTSVTGAAMFICASECDSAQDAAPAKYTKFECTLSTDFPNCDMSLVDGFSLAAQCSFQSSAGYISIGGTQDLNSAAACPHPAGDGSCANAEGYTSSIDQLSPFFQNAQLNGNNYCNWVKCPGLSDPAWDASTNPTLTCTVSGGGGQKKERRDVTDARSSRHHVFERRRHSMVAGEDPFQHRERIIDVSPAELARRSRHVGARLHARSLHGHL